MSILPICVNTLPEKPVNCPDHLDYTIQFPVPKSEVGFLFLLLFIGSGPLVKVGVVFADQHSQALHGQSGEVVWSEGGADGRRAWTGERGGPGAHPGLQQAPPPRRGRKG